jgi:hypothetical protein
MFDKLYLDWVNFCNSPEITSSSHSHARTQGVEYYRILNWISQNKAQRLSLVAERIVDKKENLAYLFFEAFEGNGSTLQ